MSANTHEHFEPISRVNILTPGSLEYREKILNAQLENSPQAIAQRVEIQLLKNLQESAPWLIPYSIRQTL